MTEYYYVEKTSSRSRPMNMACLLAGDAATSIPIPDMMTAVAQRRMTRHVLGSAGGNRHAKSSDGNPAKLFCGIGGSGRNFEYGFSRRNTRGLADGGQRCRA